ncbi:Vacuolar cation/proton exchanger 1a [Apostasia shenzhenica]|uniref:Vacuolar cation/proton exchanger n=1 Tax=Apostasia shenzhenica TaxID=1088818 RepID=A0A2I0AMJ3_9ASPA|nr:Vacuolar cation/proton exchanger 1a [Apostasia shenzhenica]
MHKLCFGQFGLANQPATGLRHRSSRVAGPTALVARLARVSEDRANYPVQQFPSPCPLPVPASCLPSVYRLVGLRRPQSDSEAFFRRQGRKEAGKAAMALPAYVVEEAGYVGLLSDGEGRGLSKKIRHVRGRNARRMSSMSFRMKSGLSLSSTVSCELLRKLVLNVQEVLLGTKLVLLFPAVPLAIAGHCYGFGQAWVFALSLVGIVPLAERLSFLTEQIAFHTGPTVGGLLNATCGNATELIISIFALYKGNINLVKYSLVGSVLSNLLLVLGTSLFCGGIVNLGKEQFYDRKQVDANTGLLLLSALCHVLPLMFRYAVNYGEHDVITIPTLTLSRVGSIVMLVAYAAYIFFHLKTHHQLFEPQEENDDEGSASFEDEAIIGFASAFVWLVGATIVISVLSEYIVGTIEAASESWGLSVSFVSIIILPIVGNAAEHAGAVIFAVKNKLDITLGVSLGSATQISLFVVPYSVIVAWMMDIQMDLDFKLLETGSLVLSVLITSFALQDGTSHYLKGLILILAYVVIGACFFVLKSPAAGKPT